MRRFLSCGALAALLGASPLHADVITTAELVTVAVGAPGTYTYSVGGWTGGGLVTGSFAGTDGNADGQLSSFDGEVTGFTMSYSGGAIVAALGFSFADLFGLVYDLNGGPLGNGLALDIEGIGAASASAAFSIGPGPTGWCAAPGQVCGFIDGQGATVPEPPMLALALLGLVSFAVSRPTSSRLNRTGRFALLPIHRAFARRPGGLP